MLPTQSTWADMGKARIGISGWRYAPWRGKFYPSGLVQREELHYASHQFDSIEINGTFYSLQRPESFATWYAQTPRGFVFAVKGPRFITHGLRLRNINGPLANFFASGVLNLREKLGPLLWQFPPNLQYDPALFDVFLTQLPRTADAAAQLARGFDSHLKRPATEFPGGRHRLRHAVEVRHASFAVPGFIDLLRRHNVALVVADTAGRWLLLHDVCADFVYVRLHGDVELYVSGYSDATLDAWAARMRAWLRGGQVSAGSTLVCSSAPPTRKSRDVYSYFDNDAKVHAPFDAASLRAKLRD